MRSERWNIPRNELREAVHIMAPGRHPRPDQVFWLEKLCKFCTGKLPRVEKMSTKRPGRISAGYKQALIKAIAGVCCKQDPRFLW